ncbi:hypothetical protein AN960_20690 [Bacillus sp. FJAT-25509]|uniref:hypothetical protein n=1 Tax=Bacillaceae TaxID=186817 RepID=UPI000700ABDF|nr:hypothetical protein [Bacillus sp. FJAT-25509]KQL33498.1 hypothetical protein AN960_20690 [Bacillus sp. FJAT-25509]
MGELTNMLKDFPIINFESKKQYLLKEISKRYPNNIKLLELVNQFRKSNTIVFPNDYPLSNEFVNTLYIALNSDEGTIELLLKEKLDEQNKELKEDYDYKINSILNHYERFISLLEAYDNELAITSNHLGRKINTQTIIDLARKLKIELKSIE